MVKVGITGIIGSGKSTVSRIFESFSIPVYYADERARWLMEHDKSLISRIKSLLGKKAYGPGNRLNRPYIAGRVFRNRELLNQLNAIVHPAVFRDAGAWMKMQQAAGAKYVIKEAALLIESGSWKTLDRIIVVAAPEDLCVKRVMQRDNISAEEVYARMQNQMPQQDKLAYADYIVQNDENSELIPQVARIHAQLLAI